MAANATAVVRFRRKLVWKREYWWYTPFAVQLVAMLAFSTWQASRFALTHDFALYWQAVYLIAHGHLNPYSTLDGFPFLDNHFEVITWPISLLYWIWPRASLLLYVQDFALVGAEWIAWQWIQSAASSIPRFSKPLSATGLLLLVLNPWTYWTVATDFHSESLAALSLMGVGYALWRRHRRAMVLWGVLTITCGDVATVGLFALALTALSRKQWRAGVTMGVGSLAWLEFITYTHGNQGSILWPLYGYLAKPNFVASGQLSMKTVLVLLLDHPGAALTMLGSHWQNLIANASPGGLLGVLSPWSLPIYLGTVVLSNLSSGYLFGVPGFQNVMVYPFIAVGTVSVMTSLARRARPWITLGLMGLMIANVIGWALAWIPTIPNHWIRVSSPSSVNLANELRQVPPRAEVVANQSIIGRFAGRQWLYQTSVSHPTIRVATDPFYVVVAPYAGIHVDSVRANASILNQLAHMPSAGLVGFGGHTYLWEVHQSVGTTFTFRTRTTNLPAWAFASQTGTPVVGSPPQNWYVAGLGRNGSVLDQAYWREAPGTLHATVTYASWGPVWLQVWNATTGTIIAQRSVPSTSGRKVTAPFVVDFTRREVGQSHVYAGLGLWRIHAAQGHRRNELEVRVFAQASSMASVYAVGMTR